MTIIVGLSDSALGRFAVRRAAEEAARRGSRLVVTAGVPLSPRSEASPERYNQLRAQLEADVARQAEELRASGVDSVGYVPPKPMDAAEALLDAVEEHDAELIVIGIRRRSPVGKALLGSTSQTVLLQADCDVLGVKLPASAEE